jgi:colanic acid/amylovoran biosynthesis glycosyltransferase
MRILHFAGGFPRPTETFIKRYVQKSCEFATAAGVVTFDPGEIDEKLKDRLSLFRLTKELYSRKTIKGALRFMYEKLAGTQSWFDDLNKILDEFKPDIIHCHFGMEGIAMMQFEGRFKKKIPYVTSFYGYDISSLPVASKKYRRNLVRLLQRGTGFFAEGPELKKKVLAFGCPNEKCAINPLLIPVDDYPVKRRFRVPGDPVKFLFVGRFQEKKGLHLFLRAIGRLKNKLHNFTIDIVGAGPMQAIYEQIIAENDLQPFITWLGMLRHDEIIAMMKDYDFLVHPSITAADGDSEGGAPTIVIEAQAVGLPVITSTHADIPFIIGYQDLLARENDIGSLVETIEKMVNSAQMEDYAQKGRQKVRQMHDLNLNTSYEANLRNFISK